MSSQKSNLNSEIELSRLLHPRNTMHISIIILDVILHLSNALCHGGHVAVSICKQPQQSVFTIVGRTRHFLENVVARFAQPQYGVGLSLCAIDEGHEMREAIIHQPLSRFRLIVQSENKNG